MRKQSLPALICCFLSTLMLNAQFDCPDRGNYLSGQGNSLVMTYLDQDCANVQFLNINLVTSSNDVYTGNYISCVGTGMGGADAQVTYDLDPDVPVLPNGGPINGTVTFEDEGWTATFENGIMVACEPIRPIPTLSTWGLIVLFLTMSIMGLTIYKLKRKTHFIS